MLLLSKFIGFGCCCNSSAAVLRSVSIGKNFGLLQLSLGWQFLVDVKSGRRSDCRGNVLVMLAVVTSLDSNCYKWNAISNWISYFPDDLISLASYISHFCSRFSRLEDDINKYNDHRPLHCYSRTMHCRNQWHLNRWSYINK